MPNMPPIPQAFFDEFGKSADDRVMDYGRACYEAALSARPLPSDWVAVRPLDEWERTSMELLAHGLRKRGDDVSIDSASWLEKWLSESAEKREAAPSAPAEGGDSWFADALASVGEVIPLEETAPEPLAQGDVVAYIESYEVGGVQRSGLVWADHPADTPGHTFKPLYASPQPAASPPSAQRVGGGG